MSVYALTPLAQADIFSIWSFIAEDNEAAADRVEQAIYEACESLTASRYRGHSRPDLTSHPVRFWTLTRYPNYSIVYRPETSPLQILAVLHGKETSDICSIDAPNFGVITRSNRNHGVVAARAGRS